MRKLRLKNPFAKAILMAVANYINEDASAYPGIETLHLDTDINEDTILARLRWLESIGAIVMLKAWVDENGRRNYDGRGRVTSSEIRFLLDVDPEAINENAAAETKARPLKGAALRSREGKSVEDGGEAMDDASPPRHGEPGPPPHRQPSGEISAPPGGGLNPAGPRLAPDWPPMPSARTLEGEESPPRPPLRGGVEGNFGSREGAADPEAEQTINELRQAWPIPITKPDKCRLLISAMSETERALTVKAARGYAAFLKGLPKARQPMNLHTFLADPSAWPEFARHAPAPPPKRRFVVEGTAEWQSLAVLQAICGRGMPAAAAHEDERGAWFLGDALPAEALVLAVYADTIAAREHWPIIAEREDGRATAQFAAWRGRIEGWLGKKVEAETIRLDETYQQEVNGRMETFHRRLNGLRVPRPWPPSKAEAAAL